MTQMLKMTARNIKAPIVDQARQTVLGLSDLSADAYGNQRIIQSHSILQGIWTFSVSPVSWLEYTNNVEAPITNFSSYNGMLKGVGIAGSTRMLQSKRSPRYQPNRGHVYSTSMILPNASNGSTYEFGLYHENSGVFFRVVSGVLYACRRSLDGTVVTDIIEAVTLPSDIDLTNGNLYDIQMQWRGIGNITFFVNQKLVHTMELLGTLDGMSVFNPALPVSFSITGPGTMYSGCVDVSADGGSKEGRLRGSIDSGELSVATTEVPLLLLYLPNTLAYQGITTLNTRDIALRRITSFADTAATLKVYFTRDSTKFTGTTLTNYDTLASMRYAFDGAVTLVGGVTGLERIATRRVPANTTIEINNPDEQYGEFFITHGDYILVTMQGKNATVGGCSIEWGVEL